MSEYEFAISWLTLSPIAVITDVIAILVITHYFPYYHGTDVALISVLVAMIGNAMFVLTIPAYLEIQDMPWTPNLCIGYVWCVLTFRIAQVLSLVVISVHWSTLLKLSAQKKRYVSTKYLKLTVVFLWAVAAIFGILPLIGAVSKDFNTGSSCKFLAFNLGSGYALFFLIFNTTAMFVALVCCCDSCLLIKHIKDIAGSKFQHNRFQLPADRRMDIPMHGSSSMAERYHRLKFARDLSKFTMIFVLLAICINHFPYTVFQALQLFTDIERRTLEVASLYLVGLEAVVLPHALWLLSRRYRHALTYQWKFYVLRKKDLEEDEPTACTLQSYKSRERDRLSMPPPSRPASTVGYSQAGTLRSIHSEQQSRPAIHVNGQTGVASVSPVLNHAERSPIPTISGGGTPRLNGVIKGDVMVERPPSLYDERPIDIQNLELPVDGRDYSSDVGVSVTPIPRDEVKRSASSASRQNWKDQMRRKHLPPIFINEGYEHGDKSPSTEDAQVKVVHSGGVASNMSNSSLNYYMSSDYHPDCLTESLPRPRIIHAPSTESETGEIYQSTDIEEALRTSSLQRSVSGSAANREERYKRNSFRTFKGSPDMQHAVPVKGIYSTFEDLSRMDMRTENEIEFHNESIALDDIDDRSNVDRNDSHTIQFQTNAPSSVNTIKYETQRRNFTSFKPDDDEVFRHTLPRQSRFEPSSIQLATTSFGSSDTDTYSPHEFSRQSSVPIEIQELAAMHQTDQTHRQNTNQYGLSNTNNAPNIANQTSFNTARVQETGLSYAEDNLPSFSRSNSNRSSNSKRHFDDMSKASTETEPSSETELSGVFNSSRGSNRQREAPEGGGSVANYHKMARSDSAGTKGKGDGIMMNSRVATDSESLTRSSVALGNNGATQKRDISIDDENASSGSNSSVTLSPYKDCGRLRPWMDELDPQMDEHSEIGDPLVVADSDTDTLRNSNDSTELRLGLNYETRYPWALHSELSTPVSSIFDEEIDRGFEDALDMHVNPPGGSTAYSGVGLCFESIKEEPEDLTSSGSNPFLNNMGDDDAFRTQAVISRSSHSNSRASSCNSVSDPFTGSPRNSQLNKSPIITEKVQPPIVVMTDVELDFVDSGFTSGLERGNNSDSSGHHESAKDRVSPWPEENITSENTDFSFESNFCSDDPGYTAVTSTPIVVNNYERNTGPVDSSRHLTSEVASEPQFHATMLDGKRPIHKSIEAIRSNMRPTPVRVKSFERYNSPVPERRLPQRGHSFDTVRTDVKPAYF